MSAVPEPDNHARLRVAAGPLVAPLLSRVVGMLAARAQCPIDRLDDALLLADAVAAHAPHFSVEDRLSVRVHADVQGLSLIVDGLRPDESHDLVAAAELPGVGNVLRRVADEVDDEPDGGLRIRLGFRQATAPRRRLSLYVEDPEGNIVEVWDLFERGEGAALGASALADD